MVPLPTLDLVPALHDAFVRGDAAELDALLGPADPAADLRALLSLADAPRLHRLRDKLYDGRVVAHCFRRGAGAATEGCVAFWLTGVTSVAELLALDFPSDDHRRAACRSLRAWGDGTLTRDMVFAGLEGAIWDTVHTDDPLG
ncbi:hypothetical protein [Urbifossiella limnaea]|uniref:Uncharacterized protein n=1 Tax=Urbifossiella limnaea TaxID=2528023 RepID=A0A517XYI1_9BACT|nr:hypothetical protein [Urbifossiella limnaea]QDU22577.1 hypothetical protein ETAA1_45600 [Urbifossiella limnaea]